MFQFQREPVAMGGQPLIGKKDGKNSCVCAENLSSDRAEYKGGPVLVFEV